MNAQTRYLATQSLFLTLYVVLFLGLHRLLLGSPRFRRFLSRPLELVGNVTKSGLLWTRTTGMV